jgi:hypothetical protein
MDDSEKKRQLLNFLDEKVFRPVLDAPSRKGPDAVFFREAQSKVRRTWYRYPERYLTAIDLKRAFISDLQSPIGQQLAVMLHWLGLPRFEDVREDFLELCRKLGV